MRVWVFSTTAWIRFINDDFDYRKNFLEICGVDQLEKLEEPSDPLLYYDI